MSAASAATFNNAYAKYGAGLNAKSIIAYPDPPKQDLSDLVVDSITVTGDANFQGTTEVKDLKPEIIESYQQQGAVDFNYSSLTNANIASGSISGVTIRNTNGYFKILQSGSPGVGYDVKFYGNAPNSAFEYNGQAGYLSVNNTPVIIGQQTLASTNSTLQVSAQKYASSGDTVVTSVVGSVVSGSFTGVNISPGDYLILKDGSKFQVTSTDSSGTVLYVSSNTLTTGPISETYTVNYAGWNFDNFGNLIGGESLVVGSNLSVAGLSSLVSAYLAGSLTVRSGASISGSVVIGSNLTVNGSTDFAGNINISGSETLSGYLTVVEGITTYGPATISGGLYVGSSTTIAGSLTVQKDLYANGSATVSGGLYVGSSTTIAGSLTVQKDLYANGSATVSGGLYVGSSTTIAGSLTVQKDLYANGSATVSGGLYVGSSTTIAGSLTVQKDLYANGSATVSGGLYVGSSTTIAGSLTVQKDLYANGSATVSGGLYVGSSTTIAGSLTVQKDLYANGSATVSGGLYVGSSTTIAGSLTVQKDLYANGSATVSGGLYVGSSTTIAGSLTVQKDLYANGSATVSGGLYVGSSTTIGGSLTVQEAVILDSSVDVYGDMHLHSNLIVDGTTTYTGPIIANGLVIINNSLRVQGDTFTSGSADVQGGLYVGSSTTIGGSLTIQDDLYTKGSASVSGGLYVGSSTTIAGTLTVQQTLNANSSATILGGLYVGSSTTIAGSLTVEQSVTLESDVDIFGDMHLHSNLIVDGTTTHIGPIIADGPAILNNYVSIGSNLYVAGFASVTGVISGKIGVPTLDTNYGFFNSADLQSSDLLSDALYKVNQRLANQEISGSGTTSSVSSNGTVTGLALLIKNYSSISGSQVIGSDLYVYGNIHLLGTLIGSAIVATVLTVGTVNSNFVSAVNEVVQSSLTVGSVITTGTLNSTYLQVINGRVSSSLTVGSNLTSGTVYTTYLSAINEVVQSSLTVGSVLTTGTVYATYLSVINEVVQSSLTVGSVLTTGTVYGSYISAINEVVQSSLTVGSVLTSGTVYATYLSAINEVVQSSLTVGSVLTSGTVYATYLSAINEVVQSSLTVGSVLTSGTVYATYSSAINQLVQSSLTVGSVLTSGTVYATYSSAINELVQASLTVGSVLTSGTVYATYSSAINELVQASLTVGSVLTAGTLYSTYLTAINGLVQSSLTVGSVLTTGTIYGSYISAINEVVQSNLTVGSVLTTGTVYATYSSAINELLQSSLTVGSVITTGTVYSSYLSALNGSVQSSLTIGSVLTTGTVYSTYLTAVNGLVQSSLTVGSVLTTGTVYSTYLTAVNGLVQSSLTVGSVLTTGTVYSTYLTAVNGLVQSSLTVGSVLTTGTVYSTYLTAVNGLVQSSLTVGSVLTTGTIYGSYISAINEVVQSSLTVGSVLTSGTVYATYLSAINEVVQSSLTVGSVLTTGTVYATYSSAINQVVQSSLTVGSVITTGTIYSSYLSALNGSIQSSLTVGSVLTTGTLYSTYLTAVNGLVQSSLTVGSVLTSGTVYATYLSAINELVQSSLTVGSVLTTGTVYSSYLSALSGSIQASLSVDSVLTAGTVYATYLSVINEVVQSSLAVGSVITTGTVNATYLSAINEVVQSSLTVGSVITTGTVYGSYLLALNGSIQSTLTVGSVLTSGTVNATYLSAINQLVQSSLTVGSVITTGTVYGSYLSGMNGLIQSSLMVGSVITSGTVYSTYLSALDGLVQSSLTVGSMLVAGTIYGSYISAINGSILSSLTVGSVISTGTISSTYLETQRGFVSADLTVIGSITGRIGYPAVGYYDPNIASLTATDTIAQAFQKIEDELNVLNMKTVGPPCHDEYGGRTLRNLRDIELFLWEPLKSACIAGTTNVVKDVIVNTSPRTKVVNTIYDGDEGILSAYLITNYRETSVGSISMGYVDIGSTLTNGYLRVLHKDLFYSDQTTESLYYYYVDAMMVADTPLTAGSNSYAYHMYHSKSGQTNNVTFHIDDCQGEPLFIGTSTATFGTSTRYISGVKTFIADASVSVTSSLTNVIYSYYNSIYGLARLESYICQTANEIDSVGRNTLNYIPNSTQTVSISSQIMRTVYQERVSLTVSAFNSQGSVTSSIIQTSARVDTVSILVPSQVQSGISAYPLVEYQDFGAPYDHAMSLLDVPELQLIDGAYQIPSTDDYTSSLPAGSPDYRGSRNFPWRWSTFVFTIPTCVSNLCLFMNGQSGDWGDAVADSRGDYTIDVRCINDNFDSGWLNALKYYGGERLQGANGQGCLIRHVDNVRQVTFGTAFRGRMYVRIGFEAMTCTYIKKFTSISFDSSMDRARYLPQIPIQFDNFFFDGISTLDGTYVDKILIAKPMVRPFLNFFDGNDGSLSCFLQEGSNSSCLGNVDLGALAVQGVVSEFALTVYDKHRLNFDNQLFVASASLDLRAVALSASCSAIGLAVIHSVVGSTTSEFYLDQPSINPTIGSLSMTINDSAPNCFSGIKAHGESAMVTLTGVLTGCVSYFYSQNIVALCGPNFVKTKITLSEIVPNASVTVTILAKCQNEICKENAFAQLRCSNIAGQSSTSQVAYTSPLRIDTMSRPSDAQVKSGNGRYPVTVLQDFGARYDHGISLLTNEDLQFVGGSYRVPMAVDFSSSSPPSYDYRQVNQGLEWRYATFHYVIKDCFTNGLVYVVEPQNWNPLDCGEFEDVSISIRVVDQDSIDTSWLDVLKPYEGGIPRKNGEGCAILDENVYRAVTFACAVSGNVYLRLGFKCTFASIKSFKTVKFFPIKHFETCTNMACPSSKFYECYNIGTSPRTLCEVVPQTERIIFAPLYLHLQTTDLIEAFIDSLRSALSPADIRENESLTSGILCIEHIKSYKNGESDIKLELELSCPSEIVPGETRHKMICRAAGTTYVDFDFYVDQPTLPSFIQMPEFNVITGTPTCLSGLLYYSNGDVRVNFTADGVVSFFVDATRIASLESANLELVEDHGTNVIQPNSIKVFNILSGFKGYTSTLNATLTLYNSVAQSTTLSLSLPYLIDTVSVLEEGFVTSGSGLFPPLGSFGSTPDMQQSLLDNEELMFAGGLYQVPEAINYSAYQPSGSPDYSNVNNGVSTRYATFKREVGYTCYSMFIHFRKQTGIGWGDSQQLGENMVLQARFTSPMDSGWLDCNAFYDGVSTPNGNGSACLLSFGTSNTTKHITFGGQIYAGELFLRVGIDCRNNMSKSFSAIDVSIERGGCGCAEIGR